MGLAASQARLLSLTSRIHDVEYQAQMIQSAKLQLAMQEDEAYRKYNDALDAQTLTFQDLKGNRIAATFNNLCGLGSINNNIATDKSYIFRDGGDRLIVPSEIYEGYKEFGGSDPYAFAMFMASDKECLKTNIENAENKYFNSIPDDDAIYKTYKEKISKIVANLYQYTAQAGANGDPDQDIKDHIYTILTSGIGAFEATFFESEPDKKNGKAPAEAKDGLESLEKIVQEYKYKLYQRDGDSIYSMSLTNNNDAELYKDKFDEEKFNYYLRWAKLIEQEVGIEYCTCASDYNTTFDIEYDAEALNQMLQSGKISIDMVHINNNTGEVNDNPTSAASDSNIAMTAKTTIDSTELKRAEAEYEKTMRDIQRKDKRYDMDLNKLETERTALTTEYDSVKKVIQDNIERTFKIFS